MLQTRAQNIKKRLMCYGCAEVPVMEVVCVMRVHPGSFRGRLLGTGGASQGDGCSLWWRCGKQKCCLQQQVAKVVMQSLAMKCLSITNIHSIPVISSTWNTFYRYYFALWSAWDGNVFPILVLWSESSDLLVCILKPHSADWDWKGPENRYQAPDCYFPSI